MRHKVKIKINVTTESSEQLEELQHAVSMALLEHSELQDLSKCRINIGFLIPDSEAIRHAASILKEELVQPI